MCHIEFSILTILSAQFSRVQYIHIVVHVNLLIWMVVVGGGKFSSLPLGNMYFWGKNVYIHSVNLPYI